MFYPRILKEYGESLGADEIIVDLGKGYDWLTKFFTTCSDITLLSSIKEDDRKAFVHLEVRDALDAIPNLHGFKSTSRYLAKGSKRCTWANGEVAKLVAHIKMQQELSKEKTGRAMHPVVFARASASYEIKNTDEKKLFGYLNHRSLSRAEVAKQFTQKPEHVRIFNIQFEDQKQDDIAGIEKPTVLYDAYSDHKGAFVQDAIFMQAVMKAGGHVASVDTATANLPIGIENDSDSKNIKIMLAKEHNSRWHKPFLNDDGSVCWSDKVQLIVQDRMDDWTNVTEAIVKEWNDH